VESTFDPKKNETNLRKHGVSLAEGDGVLNDPLRFASIGLNTFGQLRVVVYTYRGAGVRIISVQTRTEGSKSA
jgi:uncharacterized DUF497 family protein